MNDPSLHVREPRFWYAILGRGALGLLFGVLMMSTPWMAPRSIAGFLVAYLLGDAVLSLYAARSAARSRTSSWPLLLLVGVFDVAAAAVAVAMPAVVPLRLAGGVRAVAKGSLDALWQRGHGWSELLTVGAASAVGLGILVLGWPGPATVALPWLLGLEAMVSSGLIFAGAASELKQPGAAMLAQGA